MSRPRIFSDEKCRELALWFRSLRMSGSVASRARDEGVSQRALREAIRRGNEASSIPCTDGVVSSDCGNNGEQA